MADAASVGRGHASQNICCQDKVYTLKKKHSSGAFYGISLADGAGSCNLSHIGAEIVTRGILKYINRNFSRLMQLKYLSKHLNRQIASWLYDYASTHNICIKELSSTLLFVCIKDGRYISGHIGDGAIGFLHSNGNIHLLSEPQNGEYSNSTFFTTSTHHRKRLRIKRGPLKNARGFILMSDGTMDSLYDKQSKSLAPVCGKIIKWLDISSEAHVTEAIQTNLDTLIIKNTLDDCSLAVCCQTS